MNQEDVIKRASLVRLYDTRYPLDYRLRDDELSVMAEDIGFVATVANTTYEDFKAILEHMTDRMFERVVVKYKETVRRENNLINKLDDLLGGIDCCPDHNSEQLIKEIRKILDKEEIA